MTRWAIAPASTSTDVWFVDVLKYHMGEGSSWGGVAVSQKWVGTVVKNAKPGSSWKKRWNFKRCEAVSYIAENREELSMEILPRMKKRFLRLRLRDLY